MSTFPQNLGLGISPQVWLSSDTLSYNQLRNVGYPSYLTPVQKARLERIRQARLLFDGRHHEFFIYEGRSQFDFPEVKANGQIRKMFVPYNLLKLISLKSADLLFGDKPAIKVEDEIQDGFLAELIQRTALHALLYQAALEASVDGEAFIEAVIQDGEVYLKRVDSADVFPQGPLLPSGQYGSYVKYNAKNIGNDSSPKWILLVTTYLPGKITREVKELTSTGSIDITPRVLELKVWPQEDPTQEPLDPVTMTGLDDPSIIWIPNLLIRDLCVSDYDGLIELQDMLNAKQTQIARVLSKHSDPKLILPARAANAEGNVPASAEVYFANTPDEKPSYLTWEAQLAIAMQDRNEAVTSLLTLAEMSPILLGIATGAASKANAFKSVRLEAINSITKAARKSVIWKAALRRLIELAEQLEQTIPGNRYNITPLGIEMHDGLPTDTDSLATEIVNYRSAGAMSVKRAVSLQIQDPAGVAAELADIAEENAAKTPSILMGEPAAGGAAGQPAPASSSGLEAESEEENTDANALPVAA